uniref:Two pore potassium channel protein sup-9 n=1 Tax=Ditylenchus dipsaci TaxID=166011 RepID=A0A915EHG9_9BILA
MKLHKKSKRSLWLLSGTLLYLVLGAFVFSFFEYEEDLKLRKEIEDTRAEMQDKYNFTRRDLQALEEIVSIPYAAGFQWKFLGAFYFCAVVITTIGYGHSTPSTVVGKFFCIIFALVGIPLGLITFQSVGERINYFIRRCLEKAGRLLAKRDVNALKEIKSRHLLFVSSSIGILTIVISTVVFHLREGWSLFDSYYYCVITLSTIGFGDFVPLQTKNRLQKDVVYWLFTLFFILFGLAIFSACVNLLILEFMARNADIVTAKTRLKRLLSIRKISFRDTGDQKRRITRSQSVGHVPVRLCRKNQKTKNSEKMDMQQCKVKPVGFAVKRLPSQYIEHLVNTESVYFTPTEFNFNSNAESDLDTNSMSEILI